MINLSWWADGWSSFRWNAVARPWKSWRGTTIHSTEAEYFSDLLTTRRPSREIVHVWRYLFKSRRSVTFLDGYVPCFSWAFAWRMSGHSFCPARYADRDVYGILMDPSMMSFIDTERTVASSSRDTNWHIWQALSLHMLGCRLWKSAKTLLEPLKYWTSHW